ncbi:MAG: AAA family ATPase [Chloroflexi bacterium]|nr:AAA family ATPase [Chloroflexota bacterium]
MPPLVGRAVEVKRLTDALARAGRGQGRTVFLTGEEGIGKTRLAQEVLGIARARGFQVLQGRAYSVEANLAYAPFLEAIGSVLGRSDRARQSSLVGGLPDLAKLFGDLQLSAPEPLGDPALEKTRLFDAVSRLLQRLASEAPLTLFVDDLQWADPASLELFHYVARTLSDRRVMLLATCISPQLDLARGLRPMLQSLQRAGLAEEHTVSRLDAQAVKSLACGLLGDEPPSMLVDLMNARAAGTPLYVEALICAFVDAGQLVHGANGWELSIDAANVLPASVKETVLSRLARLEEKERRVLALVAVTGGPARHSHLLSASGMEDGELLKSLGRLLSLGLLAEEVIGLEVVYRITHPLVLEVSYAELSEMARRRAHAALAKTLESFSDGRPADLSQLARHYRGAGSEVDEGRALAVLLAAGEQAWEAHASDEAAHHFGAALVLARAGHRPKPEVGYVGPLLPFLLKRLGEAWEQSGELGAAVVVWAEALAEYERLGDVLTVAQLRRSLALAEWYRGHFDAAQTHLEAGLSALDGQEPSPELAGLHLAKTTLLSRLGERDRAIDEAAKLLRLAARLGSPRVEAEAHLAQVSAHLETWYVTLAREHAICALAAAEAAKDPLLIHRAHDRLALVALANGKVELARRHAETCLDMAQRLRSLSIELLARQWLVFADFIMGAWNEALHGHGEELALARRVGNSVAAVYFLGQRALVLTLRGDLAEAQATVQDIRTAVGEGFSNSRHSRGVLPILETVLAVERGQPERAYAVAKSFVRPGEPNPTTGVAPLGVPMFLSLFTEAQIALGDLGGAEVTVRAMFLLDASSIAAPAENAQEGSAISYPRALAIRAEGLACQAQGQVDRALSLLAQATEAFDALSIPFDFARTRLDWAAIASLADASLRQSAVAAAAESLAVFERLGAQRYLQRTRQLCHQLDVRPPTNCRARRAVNPLSGREIEVARLVVDGLTTPQIAERLFISQHTAVSHLRRIYSRLGVNSRASLARYVVQAGLMDSQD